MFGQKIVEDAQRKILSYLTDSELNKVHAIVGMTNKANYSLFKPNFTGLVHKLIASVAMGEQYDFHMALIKKEPSVMDIKDVKDKRKILFIAIKNNFQICYCSDNGEYVRADVVDNALITILKKYRDGKPKPIQHANLLTKINQILTLSGIRTQQDKAERLLRIRPELMLVKVTFTDYQSRTFLNISAFEYALWALDTRYMVSMMLNCLPHNETGLMIAKTLLEQYKHLTLHGISYTFKGKTITEKHFDSSILVNALQNYVDNHHHWDGRETKHHWCFDIGMAQRYLPAHFIQHYCDPFNSFSETTSFTAAQFVRILQFLNWENGQKMIGPESLFCDSSALGVDFGLCGEWPMHIPGHPRHLPHYAGAKILVPTPTALTDLLTLRTLCKVRAEDFILLESKLKSLSQTLVEPLAPFLTYDHRMQFDFFPKLCDMLIT